MNVKLNDKLFVALTFKNDSSLSRKIDGFRRRFDPKYHFHSFPHMSLLAPFETRSDDTENLISELKEELESFFYGYDPLKMAFTGVHIHTHKRKNIVFLNPSYSADLEFCLESVQNICTSFMPSNIKYKPNPKQFLPLGEFQSKESLDLMFESIRDEFTNMGELTVSGVSVFQKRAGIWTEKENLISFDSCEDKFLQLQYASL